MPVPGSLTPACREWMASVSGSTPGCPNPGRALEGWHEAHSTGWLSVVAAAYRPWELILRADSAAW